MARRGSARRGGFDDPERTSLPLWAAGLSTLGAILLFFQTGAPALRERSFLERTEQRIRGEERDLLRRLNADTRHRVAMEIDPAAVLRELVKRGIDPEQVLPDPRQLPLDEPDRGVDPGGIAGR